MSSLHNDIASWAAMARRNRLATIELDLKTAEEIAAQMVEMGQRIVELEHQLRNESERCAQIAETLRHEDYSSESAAWVEGTEAAASAIRKTSPR